MAQKQNAKLRISRDGDKLLSISLPSTERSVSRLAKPLPGRYPSNGKPRRFLGTAVFSEQAWREIARSLKLSGQELRIVRGMFDDCTEGTIAANLKISPHTVHTHCERLYRKLAVTGRLKLVLRIMDEFLALTAAPGSGLPPVCANFAPGRCPLCHD